MSKIVVTKRSNKGFTLIELLVVVVIIGVLAAVALPNLIGQTDKARTTEATAVISAINTGQEAQFQENSTYITLGNITGPAFIGGTVASAAKAIGNASVVATGDGVGSVDAASILGINIATSNWLYATEGTPTTWGIGATGTKAPFVNLQAYSEKNLNRTLLDSDNTL